MKRRVYRAPQVKLRGNRMDKVHHAERNGWMKTGASVVVVVGLIYGCSQMDSAPNSEVLERGGSVLAHVRMKQPTTWDNRCKFQIELLGGGSMKVCATGCNLCDNW